VFWLAYFHEVPPDIRPSLTKVVKAYYLSKLTGSYWENELEIQAEKIAGFNQNDRVAFYRNVMLCTCDLDTSRANVFVNKLGDDASALREDLVNLKKTDKFDKLSEKQQKVLLGWIEDLDIVIKQQSWFKEYLIP
jgi:hypothetical protein